MPQSSPQPRAPLRRALQLGAAGGRRWVMAHVPLIVLQGAVPMLGLYIMKLLLDAIDHGVRAEDHSAAFVPVFWLVAAAAGTALLGALLSSAESVVGDAHARAVADAVAHTIHERAAGLDLACFEDPDHYDTLYRAQQEAPQRPMRIVRELAGLLRSLVLLAFMGGLLIALHWSVPFLVIAAAVPAVLVRMRASRELFDWQQNTAADQREAAYLSSLLTGRAAAKEVRAFDLGDDLSGRFDRIRKKLREDNLAMTRRRSLHGLLAQMPAGAVLFSAYAWLGWRALAGMVTIGDVAMYAQAITRCLTAVQGVLGALAGLGEHRLFLSHYFAFLDLPCRITAPAEPKAVPTPIRNGVRCEGVVFRYPGQREPVLRGVDLDLRMGEKVGLVGPNGAGKSTLVQLLCRLHDPEDGFVRCDGIDLRSFDPAKWRARLGVLFQDALPLEFSAMENVTMALDGQPAETAQQASRKRALAAMETAGIGERLGRLPQGVDTRLGRRFAGGQDLSAGEWRKLLLARAAARQADVLVLDEPSAFLDARAELELFERLAAATAGKALLLISHRPLSLRLCDRIYVMEQGRIVEAGGPKELAARDGPYARLFATRQQIEG